MPAPVELLRKVPLFNSVTDAELAELAQRFRERRCDRGSAATSQGSAGIGFFVIGEGRAVVKLHGEPVRRLGPGDFFGDVAIIDGGRRSAQIVAETNMLAYGIPASEFRAFVKRHGEVAWALLEAVVARLRETQDRAIRPRAPV
jgi:CRP/FNR family transcriptional regulator, cyclic AMP receptor protein